MVAKWYGSASIAWGHIAVPQKGTRMYHHSTKRGTLFE